MKAKDNKKYYLHRKIKKSAKIIPRQKTIFYPNTFEATPKQRHYLHQLSNKPYNYQIQYELC